MKKYYNLVVSVLDESGDRIDSIDITTASNKETILAESEKVENQIKTGVYDNYKSENTTLVADIEVHNDETGELLYII